MQTDQSDASHHYSGKTVNTLTSKLAEIQISLPELIRASLFCWVVTFESSEKHTINKCICISLHFRMAPLIFDIQELDKYSIAGILTFSKASHGFGK